MRTIPGVPGEELRPAPGQCDPAGGPPLGVDDDGLAVTGQHPLRSQAQDLVDSGAREPDRLGQMARRRFLSTDEASTCPGSRTSLS